MNPAARLSLVDRADSKLSIVAQCGLLKVARSTLYYRPAPVSMDDLRLMRRIDEQYLATPFYGSRRMVAVLRREGEVVNRKRMRRLMRVMGIEAIYQRPNTSRRHPAHKVYPYLLRGLAIDRVNQVWCADITYIPMAKGFVYLVAVMDWFSRRVLAWRLSIGMETEFCVEALQDAMDQHGQPGIFNTDQGVQFTSAAFIDELASRGVRISMDGKGRFLDNIFIERLWRSLKYEEVFIKAYTSVAEARSGVGAWLGFYNNERPHQALGYRTPREIFAAAGACGYVDNAPASLRSAPALTTYPQAQQQQQKSSINEGKVLRSFAAPLIRVGALVTGGSLS
jgi:putative transposase